MDMKLTEKLIFLRKESGLSQAALAEKLSVSRQTVSNWELGEASPTSDSLRRLGELYNVTVDYLVNDGAERPTTAVAVAEKPEKYRWRKPAFIGAAVGLAIAAVIALLAVAYSAGYSKGVEDSTPTYPVHTDIIDPADIEGTIELYW